MAVIRLQPNDTTRRINIFANKASTAPPGCINSLSFLPEFQAQHLLRRIMPEPSDAEKMRGVRLIRKGDPIMEVFYRTDLVSNSHRDSKAFLNTPHESHRTTTAVVINGDEVEDEDVQGHVNFCSSLSTNRTRRSTSVQSSENTIRK